VAPDPSRRLLFTPGPLTTSDAVKQAMLHDAGSRDADFVQTVASIRERLLALAGVSRQSGYECILLPGSGTYSVEAVVSSAMPHDKTLLVMVNGAYGERIVQIAERHRIPVNALRCEEDQAPDPNSVGEALAADPEIAMVAVVHCETTTGIINPVEAIGRVVADAGRSFFVDAMSSFGAIPLDFAAANVDYLVSSANKCIEGVPGFAFTICRREALLASEGRARTLSLDLVAQWRGLEASGQFRFTPPTHVILAFDQALRELDEEGGVGGRARRYAENQRTLTAGMRDLGFQEYLPPEKQSYIITSFRYPAHPNFDFEAFYSRLAARGMIIYPGKLSRVDCFRIGSIGRIFPDDVRALLAAVSDVLTEMGVPIPVPTAAR
jgi:2-aminoethylphosphonate-pyruvate transaminase